jgi:hypothetical protein
MGDKLELRNPAAAGHALLNLIRYYMNAFSGCQGSPVKKSRRQATLGCRRRSIHGNRKTKQEHGSKFDEPV